MDLIANKIKFSYLMIRLLVLLSMMPSFISAHPVQESSQISFIVSQRSESYSQVVAAIRTDLPAEGYIYQTIYQDSIDSNYRQIASSDLVITVGASAAEVVMRQKPDVKIVAVLITDSAFSSLAKKYFGSREAALSAGISVICLDQPVQRSIELAKLLLPDAEVAGLMLGPTAYEHAEVFARQINSAGITPNIARFSAKDNPILVIEPVLSQSDIFIPIPDTRLINIATAKWILQLSYRHRVPVIAYSKAYLKGGALAALYSSPDDVGRQTAELISRHFRSPVSDGAAYMPTYFSIDFNDSVAAFFNLDIKTQEFYINKLAAD